MKPGEEYTRSKFMKEMMIGGVKKPMLSHIPPVVIQFMAMVMDYGADKYERDNWQKAFENGNEDGFHTYMSAGMRHLNARLKGEMNDPETGLPHMAHALSCFSFVLWGDEQTQEEEAAKEPLSEIAQIIEDMKQPPAYPTEYHKR